MNEREQTIAVGALYVAVYGGALALLSIATDTPFVDSLWHAAWMTAVVVAVITAVVRIRRRAH